MYLRDASSEVRVFDREGRFLHALALPAVGTVTGFGGGPDDPTTFYSFVSFNSPPVIFEYYPDTGASTLFRKSATNFDPDDFVVEQRFFESKDKTRIPMFVCYRKGLRRNGKNLAHLSGYGGFDISRTPAFSPADVLLMEQGGVYASVNLRGGGEYGEAWHRAGMLSEKQNVFDDFMAAADFLIAEGYTGPGKIAASGGSNGGLLVGACLVQRPDLYTVVFPRVGVLDMLRYHKFTVGWGWVVEYGSSDNAEQFAYLLRYSPLHNIRQGVRYPSVLVMTADGADTPVLPAKEILLAADLKALAKRKTAQHTAAAEEAGRALKGALAEQNKLHALRERLLRDYLAKLMDQRDYERIRAKYQAEEDDLNARIKELRAKQREEKRLLTQDNPWFTAVTSCSLPFSLTRETAKLLIERITVYDNARWEITFRFRDERQAILEDAMREGART